MRAGNFDFVKFPEFKEEAENIGDYPRLEDTPDQPVLTKTDGEWDRAARGVQAEAEEFSVPSEGDLPKTDAEIEKALQDNRDKVEAYKLDDPQ